MKLHVLGCHGGELPHCKSTCFLIDDVLALDAGALTSVLDLEQLTRVDHVVLTHSHFDHVKDLPLMADLLVGRRSTPVTVWASRECTRALRASMFNNDLWPDFTKIPTRRAPVLKFRSFRPGRTFQAGPFRIKSIPVSHPVESCGFIVSRDGVSLGISGDTGPTEQLWKVANATEDLKAMLVETSFPNALQRLAEISGHLTPATLEEELAKFDRRDAKVLLYHLKPAFVEQLKAEVAHLPVQPLELQDVFEF